MISWYTSLLYHGRFHTVEATLNTTLKFTYMFICSTSFNSNKHHILTQYPTWNDKSICIPPEYKILPSLKENNTFEVTNPNGESLLMMFHYHFRPIEANVRCHQGKILFILLVSTISSKCHVFGQRRKSSLFPIPILFISNSTLYYTKSFNCLQLSSDSWLFLLRGKCVQYTRIEMQPKYLSKENCIIRNMTSLPYVKTICLIWY